MNNHLPDNTKYTTSLTILFIITLIYIMFTPLRARSETSVRVRVFTYAEPDTFIVWSDHNMLRFSPNQETFDLPAGQKIKIWAQNNRLIAVTASIAYQTASLQLMTDTYLALEGAGEIRYYRGQLTALADQEKPVLINTLNIEDYLTGVISQEIESSSSPAALQAQAVVSRSYALANLNRHQADGYDFCDLTHCQVYRGVRAETPATIAAVESTCGQILTYRGQVLETFFTANCGGQTALPSEIWGRNSPGWSVVDEACHDFPHFAWKYEISAKKLLAILQNDPRSHPGAILSDISVTKKGISGRPLTVLITGETQIQLDIFTFWSILAAELKWGKIKSTFFEISPNREQNTFIFRGNGFGHGVGLCQSGAQQRAAQGMSYTQILKFYFPGANLQNQK